MNRKLVLISIIILALSNISFRWPVDNQVITATFGESRSDHFHDGIDMTGTEDNVYPIEQGNLLYAWNRSLFPLENYWGGGNFKVLAHNNGTLSVYMHLQDIDSLQNACSEKDIIAQVGNTGHSYGKHLHLTVLYPDKRESINPLSVLPAYPDVKAPQIMNFYFKIDNRYIRINDKSDIRLTKHYPLLIEIRDTIRGNENLGLYSIKVLFNGNEVLNYDFSKIYFSSNGLSVKMKTFDDLYDEKGYYKLKGLTYNQGINTLSVSAVDFNGNISEKNFTMNVNLDMQ